MLNRCLLAHAYTRLHTLTLACTRWHTLPALQAQQQHSSHKVIRPHSQAPELFELPHKAHPMQFKADPGVQACDSKLDVWAVGVLTYEMLVGRAPFVGDASADTVRQISSGFKGHFPATVRMRASPPTHRAVAAPVLDCLPAAEGGLLLIHRSQSRCLDCGHVCDAV